MMQSASSNGIWKVAKILCLHIEWWPDGTVFFRDSEDHQI